MNQEPEQQACGVTHCAGCACREQGWQNKWQAAVEMAARAQIERDDLQRQLAAELRSWNALTNEVADLRMDLAVAKSERNKLQSENLRLRAWLQIAAAWLSNRNP